MRFYSTFNYADNLVNLYLARFAATPHPYNRDVIYQVPAPPAPGENEPRYERSRSSYQSGILDSENLTPQLQANRAAIPKDSIVRRYTEQEVLDNINMNEAEALKNYDPAASKRILDVQGRIKPEYSRYIQSRPRQKRGLVKETDLKKANLPQEQVDDVNVLGRAISRRRRLLSTEPNALGISPGYTDAQLRQIQRKHLLRGEALQLKRGSTVVPNSTRDDVLQNAYQQFRDPRYRELINSAGKINAHLTSGGSLEDLPLSLQRHYDLISNMSSDDFDTLIKTSKGVDEIVNTSKPSYASITRTKATVYPEDPTQPKKIKTKIRRASPIGRGGAEGLDLTATTLPTYVDRQGYLTYKPFRGSKKPTALSRRAGILENVRNSFVDANAFVGRSVGQQTLDLIPDNVKASNPDIVAKILSGQITRITELPPAIAATVLTNMDTANRPQNKPMIFKGKPQDPKLQQTVEGMTGIPVVNSGVSIPGVSSTTTPSAANTVPSTSTVTPSAGTPAAATTATRTAPVTPVTAAASPEANSSDTSSKPKTKKRYRLSVKEDTVTASPSQQPASAADIYRRKSAKLKADQAKAAKKAQEEAAKVGKEKIPNKLKNIFNNFPNMTPIQKKGLLRVGAGVAGAGGLLLGGSMLAKAMGDKKAKEEMDRHNAVYSNPDNLARNPYTNAYPYRYPVK